ncbi:MAG: FKBP-type peptidyl-prolyl cis-trans isomerase [Deltaproteobacteria bacterium]|nr:FKBP-type peptidyl-prolyl cis-trans isomerase [Deltaproteobacteria bacterium]
MAATHTPSPAIEQRVAVAADGPRTAVDDTPSAAPPADAQYSESGLASIVLVPGRGTEQPGPGARIRAHYIGWTAADLAKFDSSYDRGEPIDFEAEHVIRGWGEIIGAMVVGERRRVWIPESLAYEGRPGMPAGMLIFDIELLAFEPPAAGG